MISFATPNAAAVPGTRSRREKAQASIPPVAALAAGSILSVPHRPSLALDGGARGGEVVRGVLDALVVWLAAMAAIPLLVLVIVADGLDLWIALGGLLLSWAVLEMRSRREAMRSHP